MLCQSYVNFMSKCLYEIYSPPPLLNNLKKTAELVLGTCIPHPLSVDPGRGVRSRVDPQANGHVQLDLESSYRFLRILDS